MNDINEYLRKHRKTYTFDDGHTMPELTPRIHCADGYNVSVQADEYKYCTPRNTGEPYYDTVELGYPSAPDPLLDEWCEDRSKPTETVYGYVPVEVVNALIEKHGGIVPPPEPVKA